MRRARYLILLISLLPSLFLFTFLSLLFSVFYLSIHLPILSPPPTHSLPPSPVPAQLSWHCETFPEPIHSLNEFYNSAWTSLHRVFNFD